MVYKDRKHMYSYLCMHDDVFPALLCEYWRKQIILASLCFLVPFLQGKKMKVPPNIGIKLVVTTLKKLYTQYVFLAREWKCVLGYLYLYVTCVWDFNGKRKYTF